MKLRVLKSVFLFIIIFFFISFLFTFNSTKGVSAQQPTGSIPTVTGTPMGIMALVDPIKAEDSGINIRSGPGTNYTVIGKMILDRALPVLGRSPGGDWLLVKDTTLPEGQGWVFAYNVTVTSGEIPVAEVPATPMPISTAAIDPTLAAQFVSTPLATKLPTFTPSAPLVVPTFEAFDSQAFAGIPVGLIILGLFALGLITALLSYFQTR